jgi:uncharacterized protein DUF222
LATTLLSNRIEHVPVGVEVDVFAALDHAARIDHLAAIARMRADLDARETRLLAAMAADPDPYRDGTGEALSKEWVREDVACALRVPSAVAGAMLHTAVASSTRFPELVAAMDRREVNGRYAQRLVDATSGLSQAAAAEVTRRVLPQAGNQTLAQFGASVRRAVLAADPRTAEEQHKDAVAERRVIFTPREGICELWASLSADGAAVLQAKVQEIADSWKGLDERTADQRRADALVSLAGGSSTRRGRPAVNVTVALSTLLGIDDQPGELDGHGPIPAGLARAIAHDPTGTWRRLVTDEHGNLVDVSADTYRPPAPMARFVQLRDVMCCHPVCRRRAAACDLDHTIDWELNGPTCPANLMPLCSRHHHLKHDGGWRLHRLENGTVRWTTPTGHTYDRPPEPLPHGRGLCADSQPDEKINNGAELDTGEPDEPPPC